MRAALFSLWVAAVGCTCRQPPAVDPAAEAEGHYLAAISAYLKGDFAEAHTHFEHVRRLRPDDARLPGAEGELLMAEQRIDEALSRFEEAAKREPKRSTTWSRLGVLYAIKGDPARSKAALDQALALNPREFNAHEALGDEALERGDLDEAVRRFLLAADAAPGKTQAELVAKAVAELVKARRGARALEVLERARDGGVWSPALAQELGDRYVEATRWDEAIAAYEDAAAQDPTVWELVAELERRQGRVDRAEAAWRKAIEGKDVALHHIGLAKLLLDKNDRPGAEKELERALATATGEEVREAMELAQLLSVLGRKADALKLLDAVATEEDQRANLVLQRAAAALAKELHELEVLKRTCARLPAPCP